MEAQPNPQLLQSHALSDAKTAGSDYIGRWTTTGKAANNVPSSSTSIMLPNPLADPVQLYFNVNPCADSLHAIVFDLQAEPTAAQCQTSGIGKSLMAGFCQ